jgi:hypothetical protein
MLARVQPTLAMPAAHVIATQLSQVGRAISLPRYRNHLSEAALWLFFKGLGFSLGVTPLCVRHGA